jgi:hypothetical protein
MASCRDPQNLPLISINNVDAGWAASTLNSTIATPCHFTALQQGQRSLNHGFRQGNTLTQHAHPAGGWPFTQSPVRKHALTVSPPGSSAQTTLHLPRLHARWIKDGCSQVWLLVVQTACSVLPRLGITHTRLLPLTARPSPTRAPRLYHHRKLGRPSSMIRIQIARPGQTRSREWPTPSATALPHQTDTCQKSPENVCGVRRWQELCVYPLEAGSVSGPITCMAMSDTGNSASTRSYFRTHVQQRSHEPLRVLIRGRVHKHSRRQ